MGKDNLNQRKVGFNEDEDNNDDCVDNELLANIDNDLSQCNHSPPPPQHRQSPET